MRLPHRSIKSIQPLPSIYTTFPVNYDNTYSSIYSGVNSRTCLMRQIEDGIEVVPFERCNSTSAPILSPDQGEKEVFIVSQTEEQAVEKPLPNLPRCPWQRMSLRQRILGLLGIQMIMLLTIGLALMAVKNALSQHNETPGIRAAGNDTSQINTLSPIRRGMFAIPVLAPQQQSSACLANMNESVAWQCASDTTFQLIILPSPANNNDSVMITLGPPLGNNSITHGHQVPDLRPTLLSILSSAESDEGPTYHFRTTYDRTVFLKEDDLTPTNEVRTQPLMRHPIIEAGESLWRCSFNETLIEGYIYTSQPTPPDVTSTETTSNVSAAAYLPKIPYVIKLVEQRMPNGKSPYCEKMMVHENDGLSLQVEKVLLNLTEPAAEAQAETKLVDSARFRARQQAQSANYCSCQWLIQ